MTSNKHRWSKKVYLQKDLFFFLLTRCIRAYSVLFGIATSPTINFLACRSSFKLHSSVSTQAGQLERAIYDILTRKMVPISGRTSSFLVFFLSFQDQNREVGGQNNNNRPINLTRLQHSPWQTTNTPPNLTFIIHNNIYIHLYIHI